MHSHSSRKIKLLQARNQTVMVTAIAVMLASLLAIAILPTLLIRYVYAGQQLFEQPMLLEYIPTVSFVIGFGYFLVSVVGNFIRSMKIRELENEVELEGDCCGECDHHHGHDEDEMMNEMGSLAEALAKKKPAQRSAAKKSRKTAKK